MNIERNWVSISVAVTDVTAATNLYVNEWRLFSVVNAGGSGDDEFATLLFLDAATRFRLVVVKEGQRDAKGRAIPAARTARVSLPKVHFWEWVDAVFMNRQRVESSPWSADVILTDPFGHMFVIYTTEPAPPLR